MQGFHALHKRSSLKSPIQIAHCSIISQAIPITLVPTIVRCTGYQSTKFKAGQALVYPGTVEAEQHLNPICFSSWHVSVILWPTSHEAAAKPVRRRGK